MSDQPRDAFPPAAPHRLLDCDAGALAGQSAVCAVAPSADEARLRRGLRELAALAALPATDEGPRELAERLADVLQSAVAPDWVYVRLGGLEVARVGPSREANGAARQIGPALVPWLDGGGPAVAPAVPNPLGGDSVRLAVARVGPAGEGGALAVASARPDFPTEAERLFLDLAAGRASLALRCRRAEEELTERRRAEGALRRSAAWSRRLLERLPAGAYTCDPDGLITYYNPQAVQLWGRAPKLNDPVDRFCGSFKLFAADGAPITHDRCWMALALQHGREYCGEEIVVERPDGTRLPVLAHASPIHDERGNLLGAVNILVDISEQKRAQEALKEADRRKDEFLAMLAHELRNPLAPVRNALHVLRASGGAGPAAEGVREMMERQVGHMVRLVDDLLEVSRITRGKIELRKERVELAAVVRSAVETSRPLIEAARHGLTVSLPPGPVPLEADPVRLAQVVANLLNNAAKYTEECGQIWLAARRDGGAAVVSVRDSGVGIRADVLPRVFDLFAQADGTLQRAQGGLGIGLTLVKRLVEMHGGTVTAHSEGPGKGSEFVVRLPLAGEARPAAAAPQAGEPPAAAARRILVVDDNRDAADSLGLLLRFLGHEVRVAHDGPAALEAARAWRPAVVLLDIGMPGMDGYAVARALRALPELEGVVLIALTGWGQEEDRRRSRAAGFDHHLIKPVDLEALQALLAAPAPAPA